MEYSRENLKLAMMLRTARNALGWNQETFAAKMGLSKAMISKCESLETAPKGELIMRATMLFREHGIEMDLFSSSQFTMTFGDQVFDELSRSLQEAKARKASKGRAKKGLSTQDFTEKPETDKQ
jgi:transcriptional regulator with XRE-family HTH domain